MEHTATEWLTISEAVRQLKIGRTTLHRWLKQGRLQAYRIGPKAVRIRRADLEKLIQPVNGAAQERPGMGDLDSQPIFTSIEEALRPLTEEEKQQMRAAIEASRLFQEELLAKRGGVPFDESWPMIRAAREERDERL